MWPDQVHIACDHVVVGQVAMLVPGFLSRSGPN